MDWIQILELPVAAVIGGLLVKLIDWLLSSRARHVDHAARLVNSSGGLLERYAALVNELQEMRDKQSAHIAEIFEWKRQAEAEILNLGRENDALKKENEHLRGSMHDLEERLQEVESVANRLASDYVTLQRGYLAELRKSQFFEKQKG